MRVQARSYLSGLTSFSETLAFFFIQFFFISENEGTGQTKWSLEIIPGLPEKTGWLRAWRRLDTFVGAGIFITASILVPFAIPFFGKRCPRFLTTG